MKFEGAPSLTPDNELHPEKASLSEKYKADLERLPTIGKNLRLEKDGSLAEQEIDLENLVFVRADQYNPKLTDKGVIIESAYDASEGKIERLTNHFTLNHRVTQNSGGEWNNSPFLFITPGNAMIEQNGNPENLYSVDSFWAKSITLPKGSVVIYEQGNKPMLGDHENDYFLIERGSATPDKKLLSLVLKKMGYTEIAGLDHSAAPHYKNFDKGVDKYARHHGIRSELHRESWSHSWEGSKRYLNEGKADLAFSFFLTLSGNGEESSHMPESLKRDLLKEIFSVFENEGSETIKDSLIQKINSVIEENTYFDTELILSEVPETAWKYIKRRMKSKIGAFEGYENEQEVTEVFESIYGRFAKNLNND